MAYTDLGKYTFTTAADYTGFNTGNLTSVLDPAAIRVPNYELYRLLINTSAVPAMGSLPSLVQTATPAVGSSLTALDFSFAKATTKGNLIVAGVSAGSTTGNDPVVSAITLGASADNWAAVVSATEDNGNTATLWADPSTGEAAEALAVTLTGGSGTGAQVTGMAWELAGMLATSSATASVDVTGIADPAGAATTVTTPNTATTAPNDVQIGFGAAIAATAPVLSQPQSYATQYVQGRLMGTGLYGGSAGSVNLAGAAGTPVPYQLAATVSSYWNVVTAAFRASTAAAGPEPLPFTVAVDGVTWDSEQTTAGVGYTYSLGQSPLYLKTGQTLQIFWQLPAATYLPYVPAFNITGWFRYDPSVQP